MTLGNDKGLESPAIVAGDQRSSQTKKTGRSKKDRPVSFSRAVHLPETRRVTAAAPWCAGLIFLFFLFFGVLALLDHLGLCLFFLDLFSGLSLTGTRDLQGKDDGLRVV